MQVTDVAMVTLANIVNWQWSQWPTKEVAKLDVLLTDEDNLLSVWRLLAVLAAPTMSQGSSDKVCMEG